MNPTARSEDPKRNRSVGHSFEALSREVIAAALAVHKGLGPGFLEPIYHAAMRVSLAHRAIPFQSQIPIDLNFEGVPVGRACIDLVVGGELVIELKAVRTLHDIHFAQLKSYLRATELRVGLLLNFNTPTLAIRRMVLD